MAYGGFTQTSEINETSVGALNLSVEETEYVNIPVGADVGSIVAGVPFFFGGVRR